MPAVNQRAHLVDTADPEAKSATFRVLAVHVVSDKKDELTCETINSMHSDVNRRMSYIHELLEVGGVL